MDPEPRDPEDFHKIWTTSGSTNRTDRKILDEFADEDKYRKGWRSRETCFCLSFYDVIFREAYKETHIRAAIYWEL